MLIGVSSFQNGENFKSIPKYWNDLTQDGTVRTLVEHSGELGVLGIISDFSNELEEFNYVVGIEKSENVPIKDLVEKKIPQATWRFLK